jgi:hypothetical protein
MTSRPTDDELDSLLTRTRLDTGRDAPAGLRELIHAASFEPHTGAPTRALAFGALSVSLLMLTSVVVPAAATTVATLWWLFPIVSFGWVSLRTHG